MQGGEITKLKPAVPRGETAESVQAKIDAADPKSPKIPPAKKEHRGGPKGSKDTKPRSERPDKGSTHKHHKKGTDPDDEAAFEATGQALSKADVL
jgi:hypothetical protein